MIRATIDDRTNAQIYQGEDKEFSIYVYNAETFKPIDLTGLTIVMKLQNSDLTVLSLSGVTAVASSGEFTIAISAAESDLLNLGDQKFQLELTNAALDKTIQVLNNSFIVEAKLL